MRKPPCYHGETELIIKTIQATFILELHGDESMAGDPEGPLKERKEKLKLAC